MRDRVQQRGLGVHHAHAAPAAAAGGLDDDRVADGARELDDLLRRPRAARRRSPARTARRPSSSPAWRSTLSPIRRIVSARGPMNTKPRVLDLLGEVGVLGEEAVAGVDRLGVGDLGGADDRRDVEVARRARAAGRCRPTRRRASRTSRRRRPRSAPTTVWMPSSRQARWMRSAISPRLAIRIFSNIALLDHEQRLAVLHRLAVLDQDRLDDAGRRRPRSRSSASSPR